MRPTASRSATTPGTVYVAGYSMTTSYELQYVAIAYSSSGVPLWTNQFPGFWYQYPANLAVDNLGHVYVVGTGAYWRRRSVFSDDGLFHQRRSVVVARE